MALTADQLADGKARKEALDVLRSFIVQAPAGSGKTELLVQRYIRLLGAVDKPEEIVAITFTIKAAAEMRKRVLAKVPNAGEIAHRLRIQTIDAFCAAITRQMPVVCRFSAQPGIVEDAWEHYREAGLRAVNELTPAACRLLLHLDNNINVAANLVATMLAKREDRKSTRLNSSHLVISYAVFCLKKKNIKITNTRTHTPHAAH